MKEHLDAPKRRFVPTLLVAAFLLSVTGFLLSAPQSARSQPAKGAAADDDDIPISIKRNTKAFRDSYRRIQAVIQRNERLKKPRPEPYLDRAELLARAHDHEGAMKDCLTAIRIVRSSTKNLAEQARYLGVLEQTLSRVVAAPERLYVADSWEQFRRGRTHFTKGRDKQALARFDGAVKLNPKEPLFLYFRGLTLKRLNRDAEATSDIQRAVSLDVKQVFGDALQASRSTLRSRRAADFEQIQGPLRAWMEKYFDGIPVSPKGASQLR